MSLKSILSQATVQLDTSRASEQTGNRRSGLQTLAAYNIFMRILLAEEANDPRSDQSLSGKELGSMQGVDAALMLSSETPANSQYRSMHWPMKSLMS